MGQVRSPAEVADGAGGDRRVPGDLVVGEAGPRPPRASRGDEGPAGTVATNTRPAVPAGSPRGDGEWTRASGRRPPSRRARRYDGALRGAAAADGRAGTRRVDLAASACGGRRASATRRRGRIASFDTTSAAAKFIGTADPHACGELSGATERPRMNRGGPSGRWRRTAAAGARGAAGGYSVLVISFVVAGSVVWAARHPPLACSCGPQISFSRDQPGFHRIGGPSPPHWRSCRCVSGSHPRSARRPACTVATEARSCSMARRSRFGVFRFSAWRRPVGLRESQPARARDGVRCLQRNRLVAWRRECAAPCSSAGTARTASPGSARPEMVVLGPAATFSEARAVGAGRALASANAYG